MSRFSGWNSAAVMRLTNTRLASEVVRKHKTPVKAYANQIAAALKIVGVDCVREYKFLHDRRFRFDIAIPQHKIAIEFEGGVYSSGRHTRSTGYINDTKKYNLATMHGWKLLRYTTEITKEKNWEFKVADEVRSLIQK